MRLRARPAGRSFAGMIRVAIVEDQAATREGLATLVAGTAGYRVVGRFSTMESCLEKLPLEPADVLLADIGLPKMSGIEGVRRLKEKLPDLQVLMLTVFADNEHIFEAICAGACGYLLKDTPPGKLLEAIRELHDGGAPMSPEIARKAIVMFRKVAPRKDEAHSLTAREVEVLELLSQGHSYKTAADSLSVSLDTIRFHIRRIYEKLHVHSKSEAVLVALRSGILR
jgi:DNA-binding NarL/FixJ family response regulator